MTVARPMPTDNLSSTPLLSAKTLLKLTAICLFLALVTLAFSLSGRWFGKNLALAGQTTSTEIQDIFIGQDHLKLPANVIRFAEQRVTGRAERVDLYLTWPDLKGYSVENSHVFNDVAKSDGLIFLQIAQSTMSRDMSGRLEPIYRQLFDGAPLPGPAGLERHRMQATSGYQQETFFTGRRQGYATFTVRCIMPADAAHATSADCQRDIHVGNDLVVLYRFSSELLPY